MPTEGPARSSQTKSRAASLRQALDAGLDLEAPQVVPAAGLKKSAASEALGQASSSLLDDDDTAALGQETADSRPPGPADVTKRSWLKLLWQKLLGDRSTSFVTSFLVHVAVVLFLASILLPEKPPEGTLGLVSQGDVPMGDFSAQADSGNADSLETSELSGAVSLSEAMTADVPAAMESEAPLEVAAVPNAIGSLEERASSLSSVIDNGQAFSLGARTAQGRAQLVGQGGPGDPTPASEAAVEAALQWLAYHQLGDGSWNFHHETAPNCAGQCRDSGSITSTTGATALALLAFMGAGYTHAEGKYQDTVRKGLYYLQSRMFPTERGSDLREGTMYAQGLSAIALCEALSMTQDQSLREPAQQAIDFIVYYQDPEGGGWRYNPREPGDTTVTSWQLMALSSARRCYLQVPPHTLRKVDEFLNYVSYDSGLMYSYLRPGLRKSSLDRATTCAGFYCRMLRGWKPGRAELAAGVKKIGQWGPSAQNMYYNYYATLVLHQYGGATFEAWNPRMRDHLVSTQSKAGHEAGSWFFSEGHGIEGGRHYNTCMAAMTLEVYYRYMPLYGADIEINDF